MIVTNGWRRTAPGSGTGDTRRRWSGRDRWVFPCCIMDDPNSGTALPCATKRSTNGRLMMANVIHTLINGQLLPFCIIHANECSGTKWIGKHSNHFKTPFTRWRRFSENGSRWRGEINSIKTTNRCGCSCIVANISADYFDMDHVLTCLVRRMELHLTFTPSIFLSVTGSRTGTDSNKLAFGSSEIRPDFICCRYWTAGFRVDMMLLLHYFSVYDEINLLFITFFP